MHTSKYEHMIITERSSKILFFTLSKDNARLLRNYLPQELFLLQIFSVSHFVNLGDETEILQSFF
jgi:hypothetical protein